MDTRRVTPSTSVFSLACYWGYLCQGPTPFLKNKLSKTQIKVTTERENSMLLASLVSLIRIAKAQKVPPWSSTTSPFVSTTS